MSISTHKAASVTILVREAKAREVFKRRPSSMNSPSPVLWTSSSPLPSLSNTVRNTCVYPLMPDFGPALLRKWEESTLPFPCPEAPPYPTIPVTIPDHIILETRENETNPLSCSFIESGGRVIFDIKTTSELVVEVKHHSKPVCSMGFTHPAYVCVGGWDVTATTILPAVTIGNKLYDQTLPHPKFL